MRSRIGTVRPTRRGALREGVRLLDGAGLMFPGCSGRQDLLGGSTSSGQMKASLSHLQFENEQLKTEVAKLKEENRSMDDRLVQEQMHNGDLAARLDDAATFCETEGSTAKPGWAPGLAALGVETLTRKSHSPGRCLPGGPARSRESPRPRAFPVISTISPPPPIARTPRQAPSRSGTTPHPCASRSSRIPIPKSSPTTISFAGNPWRMTRRGPLRGSETPPATPPCPTEERGEQSGVGLKEAKDAIEAFMDSLHQ